MRGINQHNMNEKNKFIIMKTVITDGPISRVAISKKTGLSKMTVTSLVGEFIQDGIMRECGIDSGRYGRKAILLSIVEDSLFTLGISISRDILEIGIIDLAGNVINSISIETGNIYDKNQLISIIKEKSRSIYDNFENKRRIWGIGISSIGPIDIVKGRILSPPDFNNIHDIDIVDILSEIFTIPIYIANDMDASALAEIYFGKGKKYENFLVLGISAGIGGSLVVNHSLYKSVRGLNCELGHIIVERNGIKCDCGNCGCFEKYSSIRAALSYAIKKGMDKDITWRRLLELADEGNEICIETIEHMYQYIETVLISLVNILDVEAIVLSGDIGYAEKYFVDRLYAAINKNKIGSLIGDEINIYISKFFISSKFIGTSALVIENHFDFI